jgi:hypothetical protein
VSKCKHQVNNLPKSLQRSKVAETWNKTPDIIKLLRSGPQEGLKCRSRGGNKGKGCEKERGFPRPPEGTSGKSILRSLSDHSILLNTKSKPRRTVLTF